LAPGSEDQAPARLPPLPGRTRLAAGATLLLAGFVVFFLLAEAAVRIFGWGPLPLSIFAPHPTRMFTMAPGRDIRFIDEEFDTRVRIGPDGFRNPVARTPDRAGRPRVLALGDSFTFGYGVEAEEAWPAALKGELRARGLAQAEVINAGIVAYGPDQEMDLLRELLPRWRPDIVVLALYLGNDVAEVVLHRSALPMFVSAEGALVENPGASYRRPDAVRTWLGRHSRLVQFLRVRLHRLLVGLGLRPAPRIFSPDYFGDTLGYTHAYDRAWPLLEDILRAMNRDTRARAARLILAVIPMDVQVSEKYWRNYQRLGFRFDPAILRENRPQDRLRAFASAEGIPVVDLLPVFRAHAARPLYFSKNPHWTAEGQRLAARAIAPPVLDLLLSLPIRP